MTILNTPNLNVPYPDEDDDISDAPTLLHGMVNALDSINGPVATRLLEGVLALLPDAASTPIGTIYRATDTGLMMFVNAAGVWELLPFGQSLPPIGSLQHYGGATDPVDPDGVTRWMICDGRPISRSTYSGCFNMIGVRYGSGDGHTTFNIPNGASRVLMTTPNPSQVATTGGAESVDAELPSHTHADNGHDHVVADTFAHTHFVLRAQATSDFFVEYNSSATVLLVPYTSPQQTATGTFSLQPNTATTQANLTCQTGFANLQLTGTDGGHANMQPYLTLNHIMRVL